MNNDELDILFKDLQGEFDCETPNEGHKNRFEDKLKVFNGNEESKASKTRILWLTLGSIAATILLFFSIGIFNPDHNELEDLADVSAEMAETQQFFTLAINQELEKIDGQRSPETQKLIDDAMAQLQILEKDYKTLQDDLNVSGDDQRVIFAMITNFQNRVDLLQTVLEQINEINNYKNNLDEDNNTI